MPVTKMDSSSKQFKKKEDWATWLDRNHRASPGVWLQLAKKGSKLRTVTYGEALEVALSYGWIDGQKRPQNSEVWLQRFLPRSAAGLTAIEEAKNAGRWDTAYDPPSRAAVPGDLQAALNASPKAKAFFETLNKANRYAILWRIQTVKKAETRARKITQFVAMLEREEKIHE
jgi:uncharacterized protein YdeI (YjbR/CyaY-like superfamily)